MDSQCQNKTDMSPWQLICQVSVITNTCHEFHAGGRFRHTVVIEGGQDTSEYGAKRSIEIAIEIHEAP